MSEWLEPDIGVKVARLAFQGEILKKSQGRGNMPSESAEVDRK